nr:hypothetical protein [Tanacetum cinerariifolium]
MSKLLYTRFTKLIIDYLLSLNKSIPRKSDSKLHSSQDDHPITKVLIKTNSDYKFGMEVPDTMISDTIKKKEGYKYYMAKKVESKKAKIIDKPKEQQISPIKSGRGKGFMCYGDQVANVPNKLKKDFVPRKTRSLTIAKEAVVGELVNSINMYNEWGHKLKGPAVDDLTVQSLLDLRKGSKVRRLKSLRQKKQPLAGEGSNAPQNTYYSSIDIDSVATLYYASLDKSENETDDAGKSDKDLSNDNPYRDEDDARHEVFMHTKSTTTPNSTYLSLTVTSSLLDFIQTLLDETPVNELMNFMNHSVYIDAQTTSVVHKLEGNRELTSYISGASEVPLDIDKDENHILRPSTVAIAKKFKELIQKDELAIADLEEMKEMSLKPRSFKRHMSKSTKPHPCFYNNDYTYLMDLSIEEKYATSITKHYAARYNKEGIEDRIPKKWSKEVCHYHFEALNGDPMIKSVNSAIQVYLDSVRMMLGVESYQRTLSLPKPIMFFKGIDQRIPFTMTETHKGVVYLNQYNIKSLMKLSEVNKFNEGTFVKIWKNLIDMLSKNKLGSGNKSLTGRDWTNYDVKSSREMLKKIDKVLRNKEHLRRLEEYVGGRPKNVNPRTFVRLL